MDSGVDTQFVYCFRFSFLVIRYSFVRLHTVIKETKNEQTMNEKQMALHFDK